jgi:hypothetical protein
MNSDGIPGMHARRGLGFSRSPKRGIQQSLGRNRLSLMRDDADGEAISDESAVEGAASVFMQALKCARWQKREGYL